MKKILVVIDMQNDFAAANSVVGNVAAKIAEYRENGQPIVYTQDTHYLTMYPHSIEASAFDIHCIIYSDGWRILPQIAPEDNDTVIFKNEFAYTGWQTESVFIDGRIDEIELVGVLTDICIVSNAIMLRSLFPAVPITVDARCCAGSTAANHEAALRVMRSCLINVIGD